MKIKQLLFVLILAVTLPIMAFKAKTHHADNLYCFLRCGVVNKTTYQLIVSDILTYSDWDENKVDIRKKFAAKAIDQTGIEVWEPGISADGISHTREDAVIARAKAIKGYINAHTNTTNGTTAKTYTIELNR